MALKNNTHKIHSLMNKVMEEVSGKTVSLNKKYIANVPLVNFMLCYDYFVSALAALNDDRIVSAGALLRSSLENTSDLYYILSDNDKKIESRSENYIKSIKTFRESMIAAHKAGNIKATEERMLREVNAWTTSTISQRLESSGGKNIVMTYDILSYFSHPNPGTIEYIINPRLRKPQLDLIELSVCLNALHTLALMKQFSGIKCVSEFEIEQAAKSIGTSIYKNPSKTE